MTTISEEFVQKPEIDEEAVVAEKLRDAQEAPGYPIEFTPAEARLAGAFVDNAVSEDDARAAAIDAFNF